MKLQSIKNKNMKWWVGIISCATLFIFIMFFSYEKMCLMWKGVNIKATIEKNADSSLVIIKGSAYKASRITLNGREIFIDKDGNFYESISILPGFSIVTLEARDKFGKISEKKFEMVYEGNAKAIALSK